MENDQQELHFFKCLKLVKLAMWPLKHKLLVQIGHLAKITAHTTAINDSDL